MQACKLSFYVNIQSLKIDEMCFLSILSFTPRNMNYLVRRWFMN